MHPALHLGARLLLASLLLPFGLPPAHAADAAAPRLNQIGLFPSLAGGATVVSASKTPLDWRLQDKDGRTVRRGKTQVFGHDADSGEHVHTITLPPPLPAGQGFTLQMGEGKSFPFAIHNSLYGQLKRDVLELFHHNRSDVAMEAAHVGPAHARPAGHPKENLPCVSGKDMNGSTWEGCTHTVDATGGWYDAGNLSKDVVNGGYSLWVLQHRAEIIQQAPQRPDPYADGALRIPANRNQVSDLLDQARAQMEFFLRMQVPTGVVMKVPRGDQSANVGTLQFTATDVSGLVHHTAGNVSFTDFVPPHQAHAHDRYVFHPSTAATLNMVATAAQAARLWKRVDPAFAARCLSAAETGWAAAKRVPDAFAYVSFDGVGHYGDTHLRDEFYWAAVELMLATGKREYEAEVRQSPLLYAMPKAGGRETQDFSWLNIEAAGTLGLAYSPKAPRDLREKARAAVVASADTMLATGRLQGYGVPYHRYEYFWGSNSIVASRGMTLGAAYDFIGDIKYLQGAAAVMDYLLGRNPMSQSYVTGYGARPVTGAHHRFWVWVRKERGALAPPGALVGGPNSSDFADTFLAAMKGKCVRQTCYFDDEMAYSVNEVAINYWAPFFWVADHLDLALTPLRRTASR